MTTTITSSSITTAAPLGATIPSFPFGEAEKAKLTPWALQLAEKSGFEIWHNNSGLAIVKDNDFLADDCMAKDVERWFDGYQQRKFEQEETAELTPATVQMPIVDKACGEHYVGMTTKPDGTPEHHIILLDGATATAATWSTAVEWADENGGTLPTMRELSLIFATTYGLLKDTVYWSNDQHHADADYVCCVNMESGKRMNAPSASSAMAAVVRRVEIVAAV